MTLKIIWKKITVSTETCGRFLLMSLFVNLRPYFTRSRSYFHSFFSFHHWLVHHRADVIVGISAADDKKNIGQNNENCYKIRPNRLTFGPVDAEQGSPMNPI